MLRDDAERDRAGRRPGGERAQGFILSPPGPRTSREPIPPASSLSRVIRGSRPAEARRRAAARSSSERTTRAVQPVWWLAPKPAPVSPWKYSWKRTRSRQCGSRANRASPPWHGRRPSPSGRKRDASRRRDLARHLPEVHHDARSGRALDRQRVAVEVVIPLERLDQQVVDREPDRARASSSCRRRAPVVALAGVVRRRGTRRRRAGTCTADRAWTRESERIAVGREKLLLVEQVAQDALEPLARRDREQPVRLLACRRALHVGDVPGEVAAVLEEPVHPRSGTRAAASTTSSVEHLDGEERNQPDDRAELQRDVRVPSTWSWS